MITSPKQLFTHHDAHPASLHELLDEKFDVEWLAWDCDALWAEIRTEFGIYPSESSKTKIQAVRCLQSTKGFWNDWTVFCPTVQALNNRIPNFAHFHQPTTAQLYTAVDIASIIRDKKYNTEVTKFMAASMMDEGVFYATPPLHFVVRYLNMPERVCLACGQLGLSDEAIYCSACRSSDLMSPDTSLPKSDRLRIDDIINNRYDVINETPVDILGAKLKIAHEYMIYRRKQLSQQLELL